MVLARTLGQPKLVIKTQLKTKEDEVHTKMIYSLILIFPLKKHKIKIVTVRELASSFCRIPLTHWVFGGVHSENPDQRQKRLELVFFTGKFFQITQLLLKSQNLKSIFQNYKSSVS